MKRLFGTDGIRAVAGEPPLDPPSVRRFGAALAVVLADGGANGNRVVLGRDTRESGIWLRDAVAAGLASRGVQAVDAGVISTPGLAYALDQGGFDAGVMISASHNPFEDNGLKAFGKSGAKLSDAYEQRIERLILDDGIADPGEHPDDVATDDSLLDRYTRRLETIVPEPARFKGLRILLDCANGSASAVAPLLFRHHGAQVETLGCSPNGRNINLNCGSLHLDALARRVKADGFDIGIAFDGDADRCLAVDSKGRFIDGDYILYVAGTHLKRRGQLPGNSIVATIMSNFWLEEALAKEGITLHRAQVGDKYVCERMQTEGSALGGEQSGHIIFGDHGTTGDGVLTGLLLVEMLLDGGIPLADLYDKIVPCPQVLLNVRVSDKPDLRQHPTIGPCVREIEEALTGTGRVVLRYSGTEPLTRVMVEGKDGPAVEQHAQRLADLIRETIGA